MAKITVHRALTRLKTLDAQIKKETQRLTLLAISVGSKETMVGTMRGAVAQFSTPKEATEAIQAGYKSVRGLIAQRANLKAAVMESNAKTLVTVAGVTMSVQEAIERKNSIEYEKQLAQTMYAQYQDAMRRMDDLNTSLRNATDKAVDTLTGRDSNVKIDESQLAVIKSAQEALYKPTLIDPIGILAEIDSLTNSINTFMEEVDAILVESNAKTDIEV